MIKEFWRCERAEQMRSQGEPTLGCLPHTRGTQSGLSSPPLTVDNVRDSFFKLVTAEEWDATGT